jgi:hypothetical protein
VKKVKEYFEVDVFLGEVKGKGAERKWFSNGPYGGALLFSL